MTREGWIQWILWRLREADDEEVARIYYFICGFLSRPGREKHDKGGGMPLS